MLVTTPEKWDVVTRKPGDVGLAALVRLLIIDEVILNTSLVCATLTLPSLVRSIFFTGTGAQSWRPWWLGL